MYLYQKSMIELYLSFHICGIFRKTISLHQLIKKTVATVLIKKILFAYQITFLRV